MAKNKIFISFDYDHDKHYRYLLKALAANPNSDIEFSDSTPEEIDTNNVDRVKAVLTRKIREANISLILIGKHANDQHKDHVAIGTRNWQWWEIERSKEEGNHLIAVKIDADNATPAPLYYAGANWVYSFDVNAIAEKIREA